MLRQIGLRAGLRVRPTSTTLLGERPTLRHYSEVKPPNVPTTAGQPVAPNASSVDPRTKAKVEKKLGRLERYAPALASLSQRTGVSLPALTGAFLVLHEVTAIVPVFLIYWLLHALGVGAGLVAWLADTSSSSSPSSASDSTSISVPVDHESASGPGPQAPVRGEKLGEGVRGEEGTGGAETPQWKKVVHEWYEEGARKVERVGRRYGWLGYQKGSKPGDQPDKKAEEVVTQDAGAVADAIAAYVIVKVGSSLVQSSPHSMSCIG